MPQPRQTLISLDATPYYHCVSRCVRRAFLCGKDQQTGKSFEHRRGWIEERLLELSQNFALDVCAVSVMHTHTHTHTHIHVVLHVDADQAKTWTEKDVIEYWHGLFAGIELSRRYLRGDKLYPAETDKLMEVVEIWRERLVSVSWFMRCLNEHIARLANAEDGCIGRFWEGRFKSQALLDEAALAACLTYVDLNPVRAGMAETSETSEHTSVKRRIEALETEDLQPPELMPFVGNPRQSIPKGLPFVLKDYLELVDLTGRVIRDDKRGAITADQSLILKRLNLKPDTWLQLATCFEKNFSHLVGRETAIQQACDHLGKRWAKGTANSRALFSP